MRSGLHAVASMDADGRLHSMELDCSLAAQPAQMPERAIKFEPNAH